MHGLQLTSRGFRDVLEIEQHIRILPIAPLAPQPVRMSNAAAFFWLLFSGCAVLAWLVGYGMGYLKGVRDTIPPIFAMADVASAEIGAAEKRELPRQVLLDPATSVRGHVTLEADRD